ncbi:MAG: aspartyl protease family protein [Bdellovibrionales bacterium]|nr:aspartyl protease family protein [Bdellovibrionales bacterium]
MSSEPIKFCKYCKSVISSNSIIGDTVICSACGLYGTPATKDHPAKRLVQTLAIVAAIACLGFYFRNELLMRISPSYAIKNMNSDDFLKHKQTCLSQADKNCLVLIYEQLSAHDPSDEGIKANWAFRLTELKRFLEAEPIYKELFEDGVGTYDLMAYYAQNLQGLGKKQEAIKWYEKSLGINSNLIDITRRLGALYVQEKRPLEAISLLQSFIARFPESEKHLAGDISVDIEHLDETTPTNTIRLVGFSRGSFGVPISLNENSTPVVFIVDTGATIMTLPTSDIEKAYPELIARSQAGRAVLADGRTVPMRKTMIPKIKIANWEFKNTEVMFCDKCERLAGMNLLRNLKMETASQGDFYTLTLTR